MKKVLILLTLLLGIFVNMKVISASNISKSQISASSYDYNVILAGNHTISNADIEGSTAVQGNIIHRGPFTYGSAASGAYNIMGQQYLQPNTPALVLGGNIIGDNSSAIVIGGNGLATKEIIDQKNKVIVNEGNKLQLNNLEMQNIFSKLLSESNKRLDFWNNSVDSGATNDIQFSQSKKNSQILVANFTSGRIKDIYLPKNLDDYNYVVIKSSSPNIDFSHGSIVYNGHIIDTSQPQNAELYNLSKKIRWVFPNATSVNISQYGIIGDMFANKATVTTEGGSVNGQLIATNLNQNGGFEAHNFLPSQPDDNHTSPHSENNTPSQSGDITPSHSENNTPSQSDDNTPSQSDNNTPSQSDNNTPSHSDNNTPSQSDNNTPSHSNNSSLNKINKNSYQYPKKLQTSWTDFKKGMLVNSVKELLPSTAAQKKNISLLAVLFAIFLLIGILSFKKINKKNY